MRAMYPLSGRDGFCITQLKNLRSQRDALLGIDLLQVVPPAAAASPRVFAYDSPARDEHTSVTGCVCVCDERTYLSLVPGETGQGHRPFHVPEQ